MGRCLSSVVGSHICVVVWDVRGCGGRCACVCGVCAYGGTPGLSKPALVNAGASRGHPHPPPPRG
eukprot:1904648-Prymnesium_polylepis.1